MKQRSEEWFEIRKNRLTASDFASACGWNKYKSRQKLWQQKTGKVEPEPMNADMQRGVDLEQSGIDVLEVETGLIVNEIGFKIHDKYDWLGASPDGIIGKQYVVEIKSPRVIHKTVPDHYMPQIQGQMEICDVEQCYFVSINEYGHNIILVNRDKKYWDSMFPLLEEFWEYIKTDTKPPIRRKK
tara:strand:- start:977 stop:1528 length:552 start_codon:yes stop_codon:yes gene_type:complete